MKKNPPILILSQDGPDFFYLNPIQDLISLYGREGEGCLLKYAQNFRF